MRGAAAAAALWLAAASCLAAEGAAPFGRLAGAWSGSGTIELSDGTREPIKCRASYDVLEDQRKLQISLRCASASYNFDLLASAAYSRGAVTGSWTESTRNIAGVISGKADDSRLQVLAKSDAFSATLTLVTHGNRQTVAIRSQEKDSSIKGASITMQRRG